VRLEVIVCGVDSSPESLEATRQALSVGDPGAQLTAVAVWDPGLAMHGGIHAADVARRFRGEAVSALQEAEEAVPGLRTALFKGRDVSGLISAARDLNADLVSVGSHGTSRTAGVLIGSVATAMVQHAPCSVLIARRPPEGESFPRHILHAGDGSPDSVDAARVAARIAARHDATLLSLHVGDEADRTALSEESVALIEAGGPEPVIRTESGSPHRRIPEVAEEVGASLIVIGSRGQTGLKALGSVSERVAHSAACSVLIVRRPTHPVEEAGGEA